jgi:hypothetical protein
MPSTPAPREISSAGQVPLAKDLLDLRQFVPDSGQRLIELPDEERWQQREKNDEYFGEAKRHVRLL